jgi:uncharacterized protein (TIGR02145 family)
VPSTNQIIWKWNSVSNATGYKWNTVDDYSSATNMGTALTKTETGLNCSTLYNRYVWAYNSCGYSTLVTLAQLTIGSIPSSPVAGTCVPATNQITWNWNTVSGANGYMWNTTDNYATAINMGTTTTWIETGLTCNISYSRYAWAYNTCGNSTPVVLNQTTSTCPGAPCTGTPTVSYGGQTYNTVQIGSQCWLKENLNIGTKINGFDNQTNNGTIEKYCYYDIESYCAIYGGLYQWNEMMAYMTTAGVQGICPPGWHIPTDPEWTTVTTFLGGTNVAGGKMKSTGTYDDGTGLWNAPNSGATNESGFSSVPAGYRYDNVSFGGIGNWGQWWSSTEYNSLSAWVRETQHGNPFVISYYYNKNPGFSVRCLQDF